MSLNARIGADFSAYTKAIEGAKLDMRELVEVLKQGGPIGAKGLQDIEKAAQSASKGLAQVGDSAKQTGKELQTAKGVTGDITGSLTSLASAFGVTFSIGAVVAFTQRIIEVGSAIDDAANKAGTTSDEIQRIGFAFAQSGSSMEVASQAIVVFSKNLSTGNTAAVAAINELGLSVDALLAGDPGAGFEEVADAIGKIENPAKQAELAMAIFGKGGAAALAAIRAGFKETADAAPKMSAAVIKELDSLGDAFGRLVSTVEAKGGTMIARMSTTVTRVVDIITQRTREVDEAWQALQKGAVVSPNWEGTAKAVTKVGVAAMDSEKAFALMNARFGTTADQLKAIEAAQGNFTQRLRDAQVEVGKFTTAQQNQIAAAIKLGASQADIAKAVGTTEDAIRLYVKQTEDAKKKQEEWTKELEKLAKALETSQVGVNALIGTLRPLQADLDAIAKSMGVGIPLARGLSDTLKGIKAPEIGIIRDPFGNLAAGGSQAIRLLGDVEVQVRTFDSALGDLSGAFGDLAQISSGALANLFRDLSNITRAMQQGADAGARFKAGLTALGNASGFEQSAAAIADIATAALDAYSAINKATSSTSRGRNVAGGAAAGAKIGTAILPGWGTAIGAGIGAIVGAVRGSGMREEMGRVGKEWGVAITGELGQEINDFAKKLGGDRQLAELLSFDKIVKEAGGLNELNFDPFLKKFRDIFVMLETGKVTTKQATDFINANFKGFADAVVASGQIASDAFVEILQLNARFGTQSSEILSFISGQTGRVGEGVANLAGPLTKQFGGLADKIDEAKGKVTDAAKALGGITDLDQAKVKLGELAAAAAAAKGTGDEGKATAALEAYQRAVQEAAKAQGELNTLLQNQAAGAETAAAEMEDLGVIALGSFNAAIEGGLDWSAAMDKIGPGLDSLIALQKDLGVESDNFAVQQLINLRDLVTKNKDLVKAAGSLDDTLLALSNTGALNTETLAALERTGIRTFDRLKAAGFSDSEALLQMKDYLEDVEAAHIKLGTPIDENTQKLIDQAREGGILKDKQKSATEIMEGGFKDIVKALDEIVRVMKGDLPTAIRNIPNKIPIDVEFNVPDLELPGSGTVNIRTESFAGGSGGMRNFGRGTLAVLHGREAVVTEAQARGLGGPSIYIDARGALLGDLASQEQLVALVERAYAGALAGRVGVGV